MSSKLSDNIEKNSVFWIKWELEDLEGKKFDPPQYHYYKAEATGKKRNNMFQVRYDDGTEQYYSTRGINTRTKNILTEVAYNDGNIITIGEKQPRVGSAFQAVIAASPNGPDIPISKFAQNALNLVPLTIEEIEQQDRDTHLSVAVEADMKKSGMSRKGHEGGRRRRKKKTRRKSRKRRKSHRRKTKRKKKRRTKKAGVIPRQSIKPGSRGLTDKEKWQRMYHKKKQNFKEDQEKTSKLQDELRKSIQKLKSANKSRNLPNISPLTITTSPIPMKMTKFMTSPMTTPAQSPKTGGRKKRRTRRKKGGGDFYMIAFGNPPTKYWVNSPTLKVGHTYVLYEFKEIKTDEPLKQIKLLEVKLANGKKQYIVKNIAMPKK